MSAQFKLLILLSYGEKEKMIILREKLRPLPESEPKIALICSDNNKITENCLSLGKILYQPVKTSEHLNEEKGSFDPRRIEKILSKEDGQADVVILLTEKDTVVKIARKYLYDYFAREDDEKMLSKLEPGQGLVIARTGTVWIIESYFPRPRQHKK